MDDIQFWLYLAFAAFYFISRMMKKKAPEATMSEDQSEDQAPRKKPVSFEELLREITEQRQVAEAPAPLPEPKPVPVKRVAPKVELEEEGVRRFSDEESRKVYEKSIKMAEGYDLDFDRAESFKSKMSRKQEEEERAGVAADIFASLRNTDSAKKAVILGEILNRKY